ncbi:DUF349 domain-containing protein [Marinobacteraceae bacterium S3BR75-40.1]
MAAFLKRWFKPGKKTSNSEIATIAALNPQKDQDLEALLDAATAADRAVRHLAIQRIDRLDKLVTLYAKAQPEDRNALSERIADLAQNPSVLHEARKQIDDPQLQQILEQLTGSPGSDSLQVSADLGPDRLEQLAIEGKTARERQSAAELVEDEDGLHRIARAAKGRDKNVYQTAKRKLQALRQEQEARAHREAEVEAVVENLKQHARTESNKLYQPRLEALQQQWKTLEESATEQQRAQAIAALAECELRARELERENQRQEEEDQKREERAQTLSLLKETLSDLQQQCPPQGPSLSSLDALQKTQETRWLEATRDAEVEKGEQKDYERLMQQLRSYIDAVRRFETQREALSHALNAEEPDTHTVKNSLDHIKWPADFTAPTLLKEASQLLGKAHSQRKEAQQEQKATEDQLNDLLEKLEEALDKDVFKRSRRLLKEAQHTLEKLPHKTQHHYQARMGLLSGRVNELGDWRGFATRPKQEELCEHMEYLAQQHMEPEAKAARIKELQHEWRELGGSSDQSLWQRFKQAADEAFAPCQEYFDARNELKSVNLSRRETICDELQQFIESVDWNDCDWKGIEKIHRKAREEWRQTKPVDFKAGRPVQKRFDRLLKTLDQHLDAERDRNEERKADIVRRAEALVDHQPLNEATQMAKELQKEWQAVGITRHRRDRELWGQFRAACDAIFERRDQAREAHKEAVADAEKQAQTLLDELENMVKQESVDFGALQRVKSAFQALDLPRASQGSWQKRLRELEGQLHALQERLRLREKGAAWHSAIEATAEGDDASEALRDCTIRAEMIAGVESPAQDQQRRMALQVERLSAGIGQGQQHTDAAETMDEIVEEWTRSAAEKGAPSEDKQRMLAAIQALAPSS